MQRQAAILDQLAAAGVPFTMVAHHLSVVSGSPLAVHERRKVAERLWKRRRRRPAWTERPLELSDPPPPRRIASLPSKETLDAAERGEETDMAKLVKRTVVEEFEADEFDDELRTSITARARRTNRSSPRPVRRGPSGSARGGRHGPHRDPASLPGAGHLPTTGCVNGRQPPRPLVPLEAAPPPSGYCLIACRAISMTALVAMSTTSASFSMFMGTPVPSPRSRASGRRPPTWTCSR